MKVTRAYQPVAFLIAAILLLYQSISFRDIREPWAEDATDILAAALSDSLNPFRPIQDVISLAGRLAGLLASAISLEWAPVILSLISIGLYSYISSYFCRPGFTWLVPDDRMRFMAAISFAVVSGTPEVVGNAICIMYTLPIWGVLLLLERPHAKGIILKWLLILLSSPLLFIAIPLLVLLYVARRSVLYLWLLGLNGLGLMLSLVVREIVRHPGSPATLRIDWELLRVFDTLWGGLLAALVGSTAVIDGIGDPLTIITVGAALSLVILWLLRKSDLERSAVVLGLLLIVPLYHGLHAVGRSYGYAQLDLPSALLWYARISLYTILFPLMVWVIVFSHYTQRVNAMVRCGLLAGVLLANVTVFKTVPFRRVELQDGRWYEFQRWIQSARRAEVEVGTRAQLLVRLPSSDVWGTLSCTRAELAILCKVEGGNNGGEGYNIPVERLAVRST